MPASKRPNAASGSSTNPQLDQRRTRHANQSSTEPRRHGAHASSYGNLRVSVSRGDLPGRAPVAASLRRQAQLSRQRLERERGAGEQRRNRNATMVDTTIATTGSTSPRQPRSFWASTAPIQVAKNVTMTDRKIATGWITGKTASRARKRAIEAKPTARSVRVYPARPPSGCAAITSTTSPRSQPPIRPR